MRRRLSRRGQLVRARTRSKNEIHAVLMRRLAGRPPVSDVFGVRGRRWLAELELPEDERETIAGCLRHIDFLDGEIGVLERAIAREVLTSAEVRQSTRSDRTSSAECVYVYAALLRLGVVRSARLPFHCRMGDPADVLLGTTGRAARASSFASCATDSRAVIRAAMQISVPQPHA